MWLEWAEEREEGYKMSLEERQWPDDIELVGHAKELEFYSYYNGKLLADF